MKAVFVSIFTLDM